MFNFLKKNKINNPPVPSPELSPEEVLKQIRAMEEQKRQKALQEERADAEEFLRNLEQTPGVTLEQLNDERRRLGFPEKSSMSPLGANPSTTKIDSVKQDIDDVLDASAELKNYSEEERERITGGLKTIGFKIEKKKNEFFAGVINGAIKKFKIDEEKTSGKFWKEVANSFTRDAEEATRKANDPSAFGDSKLAGVNISGRAKKTVSNAGLAVGNIAKYGRTLADFTGLSAGNVFRYVTIIGQGVARMTEAGKEVRLNSEEVINQTVIQDVDEAWEEAMAIYNKAQEKEAATGNESVSVEALKHAYLMDMPRNIMERLEVPSTANNLIQKGIKNLIESNLQSLDDKVYKIEISSTLSEAEKASQIERLMQRQRAKLEDYDRIVTQYGTVDELAGTLRLLQQGAKTAVKIVQVQTLFLSAEKLWTSISHLLSSHGAEAVLEPQQLEPLNKHVAEITKATLAEADTPETGDVDTDATLEPLSSHVAEIPHGTLHDTDITNHHSGAAEHTVHHVKVKTEIKKPDIDQHLKDQQVDPTNVNENPAPHHAFDLDESKRAEYVERTGHEPRYRMTENNDIMLENGGDNGQDLFVGHAPSGVEVDADGHLVYPNDATAVPLTAAAVGVRPPTDQDLRAMQVDPTNVNENPASGDLTGAQTNIASGSGSHPDALVNNAQAPQNSVTAEKLTADQDLRAMQVDPTNVNENPAGNFDDQQAYDGTGNQAAVEHVNTAAIEHAPVTSVTSPEQLLAKAPATPIDEIDNYKAPIAIDPMHHTTGGVAIGVPVDRAHEQEAVAIAYETETFHNFNTHSDVVDRIGHDNAVIVRPYKTTVEDVSMIDFSNKYDYEVFHEKHLTFPSYQKYEEDKMLQWLFGHEKGTVAYNRALDKNVYGLRMAYFRDDAPTWKNVQSIPAKYFFDKSLMKDLPKANIELLKKAGVLNEDGEFVNQRELKSIAKAFAKFDPDNAYPVQGDTIEKYINRLTRLGLHQSKDGTFFMIKKDVDLDAVLHSQPQMVINDGPVYADGDPRMSRPVRFTRITGRASAGIMRRIYRSGWGGWNGWN